MKLLEVKEAPLSLTKNNMIIDIFDVDEYLDDIAFVNFKINKKIKNGKLFTINNRKKVFRIHSENLRTYKFDLRFRNVDAITTVACYEVLKMYGLTNRFRSLEVYNRII